MTDRNPLQLIDKFIMEIGSTKAEIFKQQQYTAAPTIQIHRHCCTGCSV